MIPMYVAIIVMSIFMEYDFWSFFNYLPTPPLRVLNDPGLVLGIASGVALKWFLPLGILGLIFGICGLTVFKKQEEEEGRRMTVTLFIVYIIVTFLGILG